MRRISDIVRDILTSSEVAYSAYTSGCLNLSAYAAYIRPEIEHRAQKSVSVGSVVVALSRLKSAAGTKGLPKAQEVVPRVAIESLSVHSALTEFAFAKSPENRVRLSALQRLEVVRNAPYFTTTLGVGEISIIIPQSVEHVVRTTFKTERPLVVVPNLAGITLRFSPKYLYTPNTTFALLRPLAMRRINVVEVASTFTELTIILAMPDLEAALVIFTNLQHAKRQGTSARKYPR